MTNLKKHKILVLAPHTDDGELGCGGTIAKFAEQGADVFYMVFSICSRSLPLGMAPDTLAKEVSSATKILGIKPENLILNDFDVRTFKTFRQDILETMIKFRNEINPDFVLLPSPMDIHQDHQVVSEEGIRAFKTSNIWGYEMPWNNLSFNTRGFCKLSENHLNLKVEALKEYKSQMQRPYFNENFIRSLAYTRGVQIGEEFAEAFEVIRWVL